MPLARRSLRDTDAAGSDIRSLTNQEALDGFDEITTSFRSLTARPYRAYVQKDRADRKWIQTFQGMADHARASDPRTAKAFDERGKIVDDANNAGKALTSPIPVIDVANTLDPDPVHWKKPVLMLIDELSLSCADIVALLAHANGMVRPTSAAGRSCRP